MKISELRLVEVFKMSIQEFIGENCMKFSASLSYYTVFSLPSLGILMINLSTYFFEEEHVIGKIYSHVDKVLGSKAADDVKDIIKNVEMSDASTIATIFSFLTLLLSASGVFSEIQSSINYLWGFKAKPKKGILLFIVNRLLSLSMIGAFGFILVVSLAIDTIMESMNSRLDAIYTVGSIDLVDVANSIIVFLIITVLFGFVFKTLPDGKIGMRETIAGSLFTSVLFTMGKWGISLYLSSTDEFTLYGAAGTILMILFWVYYSAIILFFGAVFTKYYAMSIGSPIIPDEMTEWADQQKETQDEHLIEGVNTNPPKGD